MSGVNGHNRSALDALIERASADLSEGLLPLRLYGDGAVYRRERERIFARCWVFVGHESEIPAPGDYAVRYIGEDPFILVRDETGTIRVLFDSCRHRGTKLCRADRGNASHFRCPYHGWTYKNTGELVGIPQKKIAYRGLRTRDWGLLAAPRVATYQGLIFASLASDGPSLEERLGEFRWYLDIHLGLADGGMEVVGVPHRWRVDADWKVGADNFAGDSYHTQVAHRSLIQIGIVSQDTAGAAAGANDVHITDCEACSTSIRRVGPGESAFWGYPDEVVELLNPNAVSEPQFDLARRSLVHTGTIFPNLSFIHIGATDDPARAPAAYLSLRQWQPIGPGSMEVWSWVLVPRRASAAYKQRAYRVAVSTFSPSGNFEQDDVAVWSGISVAARSEFARAAGARLNYQMGMPGMSKAEILPDWPGPGTAYDSNLEEGVQRTFHHAWLAHMGRPLPAEARR